VSRNAVLAAAVDAAHRDEATRYSLYCGEQMPYNECSCKEIYMAESTITSKGQTTVPADIRALVHAKPGTRLLWSVMPDGTIIVRAKSKSILDMAGMLRARKGKRVSVEEMNPWR